MMQVSTLYAQSLERQLVSRRSQFIQNLSRTSCAQEQQQQQNQQHQQQTQQHFNLESALDSILLEQVTNNNNFNKNLLSSSSSSLDQSSPSNSDESLNNSESSDAKECTDRLCKLPSQCRGKHILGAPKRSNAVPPATRLCKSAGNLSLPSQVNLLQDKTAKKMIEGSLIDGPPLSPRSLVMDKKALKKEREKEKKEAKKAPSNFMLLSTWSTRSNCERLMSQVKSGDILEFNIKLHHHWGIAYIPKNKSE